VAREKFSFHIQILGADTSNATPVFIPNTPSRPSISIAGPGGLGIGKMDLGTDGITPYPLVIVVCSSIGIVKGERAGAVFNHSSLGASQSAELRR
jgi:hypothetical protein